MVYHPYQKYHKGIWCVSYSLYLYPTCFSIVLLPRIRAEFITLLGVIKHLILLENRGLAIPSSFSTYCRTLNSQFLSHSNMWGGRYNTLSLVTWSLTVVILKVVLQWCADKCLKSSCRSGCQFPRAYSHRVWFQVTNRMPLNTELERAM